MSEINTDRAQLQSLAEEEYKNSVAEQVKAVHGYIKDATRCPLSPINVKSTLSTIANAAFSQMAAMIPNGHDKSHIDISVKPDSKDSDIVTFVPGNLFTALLLHGKYVNPILLEGKDSWTVDNIEYVLKDGVVYIKPPYALKQVSVDIELG